LDGAIRFEEAFDLAKKYKMKAMALTDHGTCWRDRILSNGHQTWINAHCRVVKSMFLQ